MENKQTTELATVPANTEIALAANVAPDPKAITPQQARVDAVASLLHEAYSKASTLKMTPEEQQQLAGDFQDADFRTGAAGKENLIYIEHASLRQRLNQVLGIGQWSLVCRNKWVEEFDYYDSKNRTNEKASRVYVEGVLLIRGCFVAEAIGDQVYYPKNQAMNYGDAVEGAKSNTLRRCAKELGIGLQAWHKDFCDGWMQRNKGGRPVQQSPAPTYTRPAPKPAQTPAQPANVSPMPTPAPKQGINCDGWTRQQLAEKVIELTKGKALLVLEYLQTVKSKSGAYWLMEGEGFEALEDDKLKLLVGNWPAMERKITEWEQGRNRDNQEQRNPNPEPLDVEAHTTVEELEPGYQQPNTESAPAPEQPADDRLYVDGQVSKVSVKTGTSKKGAWTLAGIQIGELWYNTFDTKFKAIAENAKNSGSTVRIWYEQGEHGNNLLEIKEMDVTP